MSWAETLTELLHPFLSGTELHSKTHSKVSKMLVMWMFSRPFRDHK
jgi:hypothetical protein